HAGKRCCNAEAHDANCDPVTYDDDAAVAWDVTVALCRLFGQVDRHIHGKRVMFGWPRRDAEMDAMAALQDFNDRFDTTFALLRERIETMPVWQGNSRGSGAPREC
ncbi:MAG: hypothetical protein ACYSUQ_04260, partial [Planctomycetota bacterium]